MENKPEKEIMQMPASMENVEKEEVIRGKALEFLKKLGFEGETRTEYLITREGSDKPSDDDKTFDEVEFKEKSMTGGQIKRVDIGFDDSVGVWYEGLETEKQKNEFGIKYVDLVNGLKKELTNARVNEAMGEPQAVSPENEKENVLPEETDGDIKENSVVEKESIDAEEVKKIIDGFDGALEKIKNRKGEGLNSEEQKDLENSGDTFAQLQRDLGVGIVMKPEEQESREIKKEIIIEPETVKADTVDQDIEIKESPQNSTEKHEETLKKVGELLIKHEKEIGGIEILAGGAESVEVQKPKTEEIKKEDSDSEALIIYEKKFSELKGEDRISRIFPEILSVFSGAGVELMSAFSELNPDPSDDNTAKESVALGLKDLSDKEVLNLRGILLRDTEHINLNIGQTRSLFGLPVKKLLDVMPKNSSEVGQIWEAGKPEELLKSLGGENVFKSNKTELDYPLFVKLGHMARAVRELDPGVADHDKTIYQFTSGKMV